MSRQNNLSGASVFLTGATGLIGGEILGRLLQGGEAGPNRIFCLVRSATPFSGRERLLRRVGSSAATGPYCTRITPIVGDIRRCGLGISRHAASVLRTQADIVIHCAAVTSFVRPRACQEVNVGGVRNLLEFAAAFAKPIQFIYVGSAASCGDRRDACLTEGDYPRPGDGHFVHYTETKAVAETILRQQQLISNWLILRPSIVLPDNVTESSLVRGILWALILLKEIRYLPINGEARIDVVPLSYVGECATRLIAKPDRRHDCYHISAGERRSVMWQEVVDMLRGIYGTDIRCFGSDAWELVEPLLRPQERRLLRATSWYLPFINQNVVFANTRLCKELDGASPSFRHYQTYLPQILQRISMQAALLESRNP